MESDDILILEKIIIGLIISIILYNILHHIISLKMIDNGYNQTIQAVDTLFQQSGYVTTTQIVEKNNLSDVWGRNVYVYEYVFKYSDNLHGNNQFIKDILTQADIINESGKLNHRIVITDYFILHQQVHIDFAYLLNVATYEYVLDMDHLQHVN
jgi:hypothetical protein